jgi:hypothetical protein
MDNPTNGMKSTKVAIIAVLAALSVGSNYAMMYLYNVKFMDLIVFVGGFCFGPLLGGLIGVLSWSVYGVLNPLGFSLPIWLATMFSETIYGVVGGLMRRSLAETSIRAGSEQLGIHVFFGTLGVFLTLLYDVVTNVVFMYTVHQPVLTSVIMGVPFALVHVLSNGLFFGVGCVPAIRAVMKTVGGGAFVVPKK